MKCSPNCKIDKLSAFYGRIDLLSIGSGSRIDAFSIITIGDFGVEIGDGVHISAGSQIFGCGGKVVIGNYCNLSPRSTILTSSDDFTGDCLIGANIDEAYRNVKNDSVIIEDYVSVGCGSVILPGVTLGRGCCVGALSLVKESISPWLVVVGIPARKIIAKRNGELIEELGRKWKLYT